MLNYRWATSGTLSEIGKDLHAHRFDVEVFPIISQGAGWYRWANGTWLMVEVAEDDWQLYYWQNCDPRPFIGTIIELKGFK